MRGRDSRICRVWGIVQSSTWLSGESRHNHRDRLGAAADLLPGLIDMLRNESPVSVTINNQPPGFVFIHTGLEPVGEGES